MASHDSVSLGIKVEFEKELALDDYLIEFEPLGLRAPCPSGESLLACAQRSGLQLTGTCGGLGKCKTCRVQIITGKVSEPTPTENEFLPRPDLENGWRLACQTYPKSDCRVNLPQESLTVPQQLQVEGLEMDVAVEPPVEVCDCELTTPTLSHPCPDAENLIKKINQSSNLDCNFIDIEVIRALSAQLREWNWCCRAVVRNREVVAVGPLNTRPLGMAVDLGSTKIAAYLVDLINGETLAVKGIMNPQINFGEDIISRINYAITSSDNKNKMQEIVVRALNTLAADLCAGVGSRVSGIVEAVIVGNTAMHHLLLGLPVRQLVHSPFVPAVSNDLNVKARDIGLEIAPGAYVHILPNIAAFVGADHVAMLIATAKEWAHKTVLALDIGTNTEISLIARGEITSVSCASGPAFEGYHIKNGVRATNGAIEKIWIESDEIHYQTLGETPPIGICGSGILDAVAQLCQLGVVDRGGRLRPGSHPCVRKNRSQTEFVFVSQEQRNGLPAITLTQKDVREIQLAKAAVCTGITVLSEACGISEDEIDEVLIAGAFGNYIDLSSAISIGMLPSLPLGKFLQVGNAAGMGAKLALVSMSKRTEARHVSSRVNYIEMAGFDGFSNTFVQACFFEPYQLIPKSRKRPAGDTQ
jgi:uncharacterized 2Fe-2S/4Fe-4S cluster protein (DUF4445 family)